MSQKTTLTLESSGSIGTLWINRPEKQNAMTYEMWAKVPEILTFAQEREFSVLVVRGRGSHFCAGTDIATNGSSLADVGVPNGYRAVNEAAEEALANFPRPTVAVIEGNCIGGGCQLALACDLRLASSTAKFGITPAKLGITYPPLAVARTLSVLGPSTTKRLLFSADIIDAKEAFRLHLIDYIVETNEFDTTLTTLLSTLTSRSLLTQLSTKALVNALVNSTNDHEVLISFWDEIARSSNDLDEGLSAFAEKRDPRFTWKP